MRYLVAISTFYFADAHISKLVILAIHRQLFSIVESRITMHALMGELIGLTLAAIITAFAACTYSAANWISRMLGSHCIDMKAFFRYSGLPDIVKDIVAPILPLRVV